MARPRKIDDEELLCSMRSSFLELGPTATTQALAARAGVSEGTLFKRFESKQRMFALAMKLPSLDGAWYTKMLERVGTVPLGEHLRSIATGIASYLGELIPQLICAFGRPMAPDEVRMILGGNDSPPVLILRRLTRFFELEIAKGRVRPLPARHIAELFSGALHHHVHRVVIFEEKGVLEPDLTTFAAEMAGTFEALIASTTSDKKVSTQL